MFLEAQIAQPQTQTFNLSQAAELHNPEQEMQMLGISSEYELARYQAVSAISEVDGHTIALNEIQRNTRAYEREFLQDMPVAEPHMYFHINGELHSEAIDHELFRVSSQIDPRERDGRTRAGFTNFQENVMQAQDGEVTMWYSPAGSAGSEGPFSNIHFDSGRLYLASKDSDGQSTHVDIKIDENAFPIQELLTQYGNVSLNHPKNTQMDTENFIASLYEFAQTNDPNGVVYTSQRDSKHPTPHTLMQIIDEVASQISLYQQLPDIPELAYSSQQKPVMTQEDIQYMYVQAIQSHADQNGGEVTLYGCSTTSVIESATSAGPAGGFAGLGSSYGSFARIMKDGILNTETNQGCGVQGCAINKIHFHCPGEKNGRTCNHAISGTNKCPGCGLTSRQWAEQTGQEECV